MLSFLKRSLVLALALVVAAAASPGRVHAQFRVVEGLPPGGPYSQGGLGFRVNPIYNPYYSGSPYQTQTDPYSGYLTGAADVISSQSQFMIAAQQARLMTEQINQERLVTRRRTLDEQLYERAMTPTIEDNRERARLEQLRRSMNDPPAYEIWSGLALNNLLLAGQRMQSQRIPGPDVPLTSDLLQKINISTGTTSGSIGLLKDQGRLTWPLVLQADDFTTQRTHMDQLIGDAYNQALFGPVQAKTLFALGGALDQFQIKVRDHIDDLSSNEYIQAKRYLSQLRDTVKVLENPNITNYVSGKVAARGDTVAQLVDQMTRQGMKFAPAVEGEQPAYVALHRAMATYTAPMSQLIAQTIQQEKSSVRELVPH